MTIQSSINELGLIDLFQLLHMQQKTGRLIVSDGPEHKEARVLFVEGAVGFASMYERIPKTALSLLQEWDILDTGDVERVECASHKYDNLVECLEGERIVSRSYLKSIVSTRTQEVVYELFKWHRGYCRFTETAGFDETAEILVNLNTENIILEGARRIDEWKNITSKVPSPYSIFKICTYNNDQQHLNLKPKEWEILSLIDGKSSVREASDAVACDLFTTSKLIYGLVVMGVIELVEDQAEQAEEDQDAERQVEVLVKQGNEYFDRGILEKAASEFEKAIQIDPTCFIAMRMLGEIYYKLDRLSEAAVYLKKARAEKPENEKAMFLSGQLHARLGDMNRAIEEWDVLKEKTSNPRVSEMMERNISVARKWKRVLQEY